MTLRAGVASVEIPTWTGLDLAGFVRRDNPSTGMLDPIYARALALTDGGRPLLIMVADCLGYTPEFAMNVQAQFIDVDVFLAATHTHSAPASQPLRGCGVPQPAWLDELHNALVGAGLAALSNLEPARLKFGVADAPGLTTNRRKPNFYHQLQEPVNKTVTTITVLKEDSSKLATLVHFTCHSVILGDDNLLVSADWPGRVCSRIQEITGAPALCLNGATGDINPFRRGSLTELEWLAEGVVTAANEAIQSSTPCVDTSIIVAREQLNWICMPVPAPAKLMHMAETFDAEASMAQAAGSSAEMRTAQAFAEWARDALQYNGGKPTLDVEIMVARIGDLALVSAPGELFVELGMAIEQGLLRAGYRAVLVCSFTNGNIGYIPTRTAYTIGGYEVETAHRYYGRPAPLAPEAGELLVERSIALGARLKAENSYA